MPKPEKPTGSNAHQLQQLAGAGRPAPGPSPTRATKRAAAIAEGRRLVEAGELAGAWKTVSALLVKHPRDAEVRLLAAVVAERSMNYALAREHATRSLRILDHPETRMLMSRIHRVAGQTDEALASCDRAIAMRPGERTYRVHRASTLEAAGRFDQARAEVDALLAGNPSDSARPDVRFENAKLLVQEKRYPDAIDELDAMLGDPGLSPPMRTVQLYLKAKACDRSGRFEEAFEAAKAANDIGRVEFDPGLYEQQVTQLMTHWSRERVKRFPVASCPDVCPVFIAGMPRSGTSLIDQIIDAHPHAAGVGELSTIEVFARQLSLAYEPEKEPPGCFGSLGPTRWTRVARDYVKQIRAASPPGAERIVNKALGNNKLVGLLSRLFPNTRIIHAVRDPRDVAVSCFMGGFNSRMHAWTTRLEWAVESWAQSLRMMDHWKKTLDIPILDVHYEKLVQDPGPEFRRIIDFLGLEWDDACRGFYKSKRTVRTLSYDQVNRPLYTSSVGRYANYAQHFEGISVPERA